MKRKTAIREEGLFYQPHFINKNERDSIILWLKTLYPLWEMRYSLNNPPPEGDTQRKLLRPVYWLGNWQFACLDYYHPPKGVHNRCVEAETYPLFLKIIVQRIEEITKSYFLKSSIPKNWKLNTCLINFYGSYVDENGKKIDTARVGEHKDFEEGPVASLSLGERAFFQFVFGKKKLKNNILFEQWLEDSSLQIFGGDFYKNKVFHRVQRVENKKKEIFNLNVKNFEARRINFTFRYVPSHFITPYKKLAPPQKNDVTPYIKELSINSEHFFKALS